MVAVRSTFLFLLVLLLGMRAEAETLTVGAAASLKEAFTTLATKFESEHPGVTVRVTFSGSQNLVSQLLLGADLDVFASADRTQMLRAVHGRKTEPKLVHPLCGNRLVLAVSMRSRYRISKLADLATQGVAVVVAQPAVPVGSYTEEILRRAGAEIGKNQIESIRQNIRSRESDVRSVLTKLSLGDADAGFVYATDIPASHGRVRLIELPGEWQTVSRYSIASIPGGGHAALASAFVQLCLGSTGQRVLRERGFVPRAKLR